MGVMQQMSGEFQQYLQTVGPRLVHGFLTLFVGFLVALVLRSLLIRFLLSANRALDRPERPSLGAERTSYRMANLCFWVVLGIALTVATESLGIRALSDWVHTVGRFLPRVLVAVLLGGVGWLIAGFVRDVVVRAASAGDLSQAEFMGRAVYLAIVAATVLVILRQLGIEVELLTHGLLLILAAFLFGGTLSFALGARPIVSDIVCAYSAREHLAEGDDFELGDVKGKVVRITGTSVVVRNERGLAIVPGKLLSSNVVFLVPKGKSP